MAVTSVTSASNFVDTPAAKPKNALDMSTFLKLLGVQLANQNPLEPMGDRDFFAQMAQLGQVQGSENIQKSLTVSQASALMGKTVTAVRATTDSASAQSPVVSGVASRLTVKNGEYFLGLREANGGIVDVRMTSIQQVQP